MRSPFVAPAAEDTPHRLCSCNPLQPADPRVAGESQASKSRLNPGRRACCCWESCRKQEDYDPCLNTQRVIDTQSSTVPDNDVVN